MERLHIELYDILSKFIEVCDRMGIGYFIIGGSAVGAHFDGAILPWDDDIDVGMERREYERFLDIADAELPEGYVLQSPDNEPNTPYYFAKVRKCGTRFEADDEFGLEMHHGIYIDIFPMDRVPDQQLLERFQRGLVRFFGNAFVATTIKLPNGGVVQKWMVDSFATLFGKRLIYKMLKWSQTLFNGRETKYISIVRMDRDHIRRATITPPDRRMFGPLEVNAPSDLLTYLEWHYPGLHRDLSEEEQINHSPRVLSFED